MQTETRPSYFFGSNPALKNYYPKWLDSLAEDVTLEGSMLDGVVQGANDVRSVVATIRSLYDRQEHTFAGTSGNGGFLEEYVAEVRGAPLGCVVLVTYNDAGKTQHIVASYRPRTSLLQFARLLGEKFTGTPIANSFRRCWKRQFVIDQAPSACCIAHTCLVKGLRCRRSPNPADQEDQGKYHANHLRSADGLQ